MSDKEVKNEKVMTKYDQKMQRRKEQKEREEKQKKITKAVSMVVVLAVVALIASFPIRSYLAQNETYVIVNGEEVTKVEFDYNYNNVVNDYVNQYGAYLGYFGLDVSQDFSTQMYDENLSWKDYFEEMTIENMKKTKAIKAEADAAGFQYDSEAEVEAFKKAVKEGAKTAEVSTANYVKQLYGQYATVKNLTGLVAEAARDNAYYEQVSEGLEASEEEIVAYYEENANDYDSVDYYMTEFTAEITSEEPTEEEIEAALNIARDEADAAVDHLALEGEEVTGEKYSDAPYAISDWLFNEDRAEGDREVIEDEDNNSYYAVEFIQRYRDETPTVDIRAILTDEDKAQGILDEWNAGIATEESFVELCKKYTNDSSAVSSGGLMEGLTEESVTEELGSWIFDTERSAGDASVVTLESGTTYVLYYVGEGEPEWYVSVGNTLLGQNQSEYMKAITEDVMVEDVKGSLKYLQVQEEEDMEDTVSDGDLSDGDVSEGDAEGDVSAN